MLIDVSAVTLQRQHAPYLCNFCVIPGLTRPHMLVKEGGNK